MSDAALQDVKWSTFLLDGGAMFGIVPRPLWSRLIAPDENNGIRLAMRSLTVRENGRVWLVDCGVWAGFPEKLRDKVYAIDQPDLAQTFREKTGLAPADVTDILATHLHFDHVGGFARRTPDGLEPVFPNARLHVQQAQLAWALDGSPKDRGSYVRPLIEHIAGYEKLVVHTGTWEPFAGALVDVVDGHTAAMQLLHVTVNGQRVIHTADMIPTSAHVSVPYIMAYDNEPLKTAAEKERYYSTWPDAVYFFEHDPEAPFWTIRHTDKGWQRAEPWQP